LPFLRIYVNVRLKKEPYVFNQITKPNHIMKNIVLSLSLFTALTLSVFAQQRQGGPYPGKNPEDLARKATEMLDEALDLTDAQEREIYALNVSFIESKQAQRNKARTDRMQNREAWKSEKEAHVNEIKEILTPEQNVKFEALQEERLENREEKRAMRQQMKAELNLSEAQKEQMMAIREKYRPQLEEIAKIENEKERKAAFKNLKKAQKAEISEILTDEQLATMKEYKKEKKRGRRNRGNRR
jgi:Spy/CpxP family protein refolding chaperone